MRKCSKILTLALTLSLVLGAVGSANAVNLTADSGDRVAIDASGDGGSVPVELTTEALTFSVTVPTALPVNVDASGTVTVATDAKILNNSAGPVEVKEVRVEPQNSWTLGDWTTDLATEKVGTKKFAMELQDAAVATNGSCDVVFDVIPAKSGTITENATPGSIDLRYNAHIAPQANGITETIANVVFVIGWEEWVPPTGYIPGPGTIDTPEIDF